MSVMNTVITKGPLTDFPSLCEDSLWCALSTLIWWILVPYKYAILLLLFVCFLPPCVSQEILPFVELRIQRRCRTW